jgi:hypothetical protein
MKRNAAGGLFPKPSGFVDITLRDGKKQRATLPTTSQRISGKSTSDLCLQHLYFLPSSMGLSRKQGTFFAEDISRANLDKFQKSQK